MRSIVILLALLPATASAATLPVTQRYCSNADMMMVSPEGVTFDDSLCKPVDGKGPPFALRCEETTLTVTLKEDRKTGTLVYSDDTGFTTTMARCPD